RGPMPTPPVACTRPALRRRAEPFHAALCALVALGAAVRLRAAEPVRVAVIHAGEDEGSRRLRAEIGAVGLDVVDVRTRPDEDRTTASLARNARATAAMRIRSAGEVEVVI